MVDSVVDGVCLAGGLLFQKDVAMSCRMWDRSCIANQLEVESSTFQGGVLD